MTGGVTEMKNFKDLVLCNWYSPRVEVHVRADLMNGCLTLAGQDLGPYANSARTERSFRASGVTVPLETA